MKGLIFDIKHFALNDGPGIRQTIFFKSCPLRCAWCHNPESWNHEIEYFDAMKRMGVEKIPVKEQIGRYYRVSELMQMIEKDSVFFEQSGGGVTFSGGEPMVQANFIKEIAKKCKDQNMHTLVDTCGYVDYEKFKLINPYIDLYYYDVKHTNRQKLKEYTGADFDLIWQNLLKLLNDEKKLAIRIPIIPGFNDTEKDMDEMIPFLQELQHVEIHLLPYHDIGQSKYERYRINRKIVIENKPIAMGRIKKQLLTAGLNLKSVNKQS